MKSLDDLTEGGIDVGSVTEIFGEAGSGKTQTCLQLALNCQLPIARNGLDGKAVYISSDKRIPTNRLKSMAIALKAKYGDDSDIQEISFLNNIFVHYCNSPNEIRLRVLDELPNLLRLHPDIRLVVIDSIAGIFRYETNYFERAKDMREIVQELERLAEIYNFAIIATNHISLVPQENGGEKITAALGATWDSLVVTKLQIIKTEEFQKLVSGVHRVRIMKVIYSPRLPRAKANFSIDSSGLR